MKKILCGFVVSVLLVSLTLAYGQSAEIRGRSKGKRIKNVFVSVKGPEQLAKRFRKFMDIALDDNNLTAVTDSASADAFIDVEITEETVQGNLYATVASAEFAHKKGDALQLNACVSVGDTHSDNPQISHLYIPDALKKSDARISTIWVADTIEGVDPYLIAMLKRELRDAEYKMPSNAADADVVLKSLKVHEEPISIGILKKNIHVRAALLSESTAFYNSNHPINTYKSVHQPISDSAKECLSTAETFGGPFGEPFWEAARRVAEIAAKD
jgi:hypothetical protein